MQVSLAVTNKGSNESTNVDLAVEKKITIGRHLGSPVLLQGDRLSRHHFFLMVIDGALTIEDLSSNGTWLNGALLKEHESARVQSGDTIEVPGYEMQITIRSAAVSQRLQVEAPIVTPSKEPMPTRKQPLVVVLHILEPREVALLFIAAASFALISFCLNR
jgi:predicted component of type VI protein secretion system